MKNLLFLAALASIAILSSYKDEFDLGPDPKEVIEILGHDEFGGISPVKINNTNQVIGYYGGLVPEASSGLTQLRAMTLNADFIGFRDITPENSEIYSEMVSINNQGLALGTLGLPRKNTGVANKIMVLEFY